MIAFVGRLAARAILGSLAAVAGVGIAVAGCAGPGGQPATLPDLPAATSAPRDLPGSASPATPRPSAAAEETPVFGPEAHVYSYDGVVAFTYYVIEVINHAYETGDAAALERVMTTDCVACASAVSTVTGRVGDGGRMDGGILIPKHISAQAPTDGVRTSAAVDLTVTAANEFDEDGRLVDSSDEQDIQLIFDYTREDEQWKLDGIRRGSW